MSRDVVHRFFLNNGGWFTFEAKPALNDGWYCGQLHGDSTTVQIALSSVAAVLQVDRKDYEKVLAEQEANQRAMRLGMAGRGPSLVS